MRALSAPIAILFVSLWGQVGLSASDDPIAVVFDALDQDFVPLQEARSMWASGEKESAIEALLAYFDERPMPQGVLDDLVFMPSDRSLADAALVDRYYLQDVWATQPRRPDGGLDWTARGPREDPEWAWLLNRHRHFRALLSVYEESKDVRYLERIEFEVTDWIQNNPYPNRLTFSSGWRALEVARRILESWLHVWEGMRNSEAGYDAVRIAMLGSFLDHADALREHASFWGGNHLVTELTALVKLARAFPEFEQSSEWLSYAVERSTDEILSQTYPDGSYKELTNHYQRVAAMNAQRLLESVVGEPSWRDDRGFSARVEAMWEYFLMLAKPNGYGPKNNASDSEFNLRIVEDIASFFENERWDSILTEEVWPEGAVWFPYAGHLIDRAGEDEEQSWLFFDLGPYGTAHQHRDRMHVSLFSHRREWTVDGGRYTYQPGPWLEYFKGPNSHNTLKINGVAAVELPDKVDAPQVLRKLERPDRRVVFGGSAHFPQEATPGHLPVRWRRSVVTEAPGLWVIVDEVISFAPIDVTFRWHFSPDVTLEHAEHFFSPAQIETNDSSFRLNAESFRGQEVPDVAGWHSPQYNVRLPAVERRFSGRTNGPFRVVWLAAAPGHEHDLPDKVALRALTNHAALFANELPVSHR